jgi:hypothetical protein
VNMFSRVPRDPETFERLLSSEKVRVERAPPTSDG